MYAKIGELRKSYLAVRGEINKLKQDGQAPETTMAGQSPAIV